jgi:cytochrome c oxidase subunit II
VTGTRHEFDELFFDLYLPVMVGVVAIVVALVAFAVLRSRRRRHRPASGRSEIAWAEGLYALLLAGVAAVLVAATFRVEERVDAVSSAPAARIRVTGFSWGWRFDYATGVSVLGNDRRPPELVVPAGRTVRFDLGSRDVIHAFWIPDLRFKRDAFPRRRTRFDLVFTEGTFAGSCAEFCGLHHAEMTFTVRALPPAEFLTWLRNRGPA